MRKRLPDRRQYTGGVARWQGWIISVHVGLYPDGAAGEIFAKIERDGTTVAIALDEAAELASLALQYGAPMERIASCARLDHFGNPETPIGAALLAAEYFSGLRRPGTEKFILGGSNEDTE